MPFNFYALSLRHSFLHVIMIDKYRILVVDDEEDLCEILKYNLEDEGYEVETAYSAEEALKLDLSRFHLLLLDVMMGEISGFKMAKTLKEHASYNHISIIFLTARDTENDMVTGFKIGADDYISKPFSLLEVKMRVRAVLRRAVPTICSTESHIGYKGLSLDLNRKTAILDGETLTLTKTEFELLRMFLDNEGRVYSRAEILRKVWHNDISVLDRTIDVNITRLRKKLNEYGKYIITRTGYGYCFDTNIK